MFQYGAVEQQGTAIVDALVSIAPAKEALS